MKFGVATAAHAALLVCSIVAAPADAAAEQAPQDILLRSPEQWEAMERIHRTGVNHRLSEVVDAGEFGTSVNLGFRGEINWIDIWGPTFTCPTMEHVGIIGDGGKWVCGVNEFLQRPGCVIYSLGSFYDYTFEAAMLERTPCEIHVFDPTVLPSQMREREALLNGDGPTRVKWHSVGISDVDTDDSSLLTCYGGTTPRRLQRRRQLRAQFDDPRWHPNDAAAGDAGGGHEEQQIVSQEVENPDPQPEPEEDPNLSPRDRAVREIVGKLKETRDRITSSEERCGPESRRPGGIAPPPAPTDAGSVLGDMNATPHGDAKTLCRLATLPSIMKTLGHDWVDVFKMDVEGSEFQALSHLAGLPGDAMRFTQLQLEIHHEWSHQRDMPNVAQLSILHGMLEHNYRMALLEPNIYFAAQTCHELAMLKVDECGNVITPDPHAAAEPKSSEAGNTTVAAL